MELDAKTLKAVGEWLLKHPYFRTIDGLKEIEALLRGEMPKE